MRLAIVHKEKCKPNACGHECKKFCPVEKREADTCVVIKPKSTIDEKTCIGCGICEKRCPFDAIKIINLPSVDENDLVHRYGPNGFALYGLPIPKEGKVLGLLGRNGIGKSTAVKILAGTEKMNFGLSQEYGSASSGDGEFVTPKMKKFFQGSELLKYFQKLEGKKVAYKPQNLSKLAVNVSVRELLEQRGSKKEIESMAKELNVVQVLDNKMDKLSGGELQRVAILAASLGDADIYFYDEPLAFLDISERLRVSDFISKIAENKTVVVVEHDLLILDYLTDYLNIFFGAQGAFGLVSGVKTSKAGVNAYLHGFLTEENLRIRDKELNFNFTKNPSNKGKAVASWPDFSLGFESGFKLDVKAGEVHENHVIGILGRNGTGKTSFVRALAGEIKVEGLDVDLDISYKPQYLFTDEETLVRDVIIREKIGKKLAQQFNLGVLQQKKIGELSGGELQRFSIARCLAKDADLYLIDEPSAYLDVEERISVAKAIKEIMAEKEKTAFVVDHDLLLVSYLADNILVFSGQPGKHGESGKVLDFEEGISELLKSLDITLRKDVESGRPRINKKGSVKDRDQKGRGQWAVF